MASWHADSWAAAGTWATAFVTAGLWLYTAMLWRVTKASVKVAQEAAEGLPLIERAYVYLTLKWIPEETNLAIPDTPILMVNYEVRNFGRTPARVTEARICAVFETTPPHVLPYKPGWHILGINAILGSSETYLEAVNAAGAVGVSVPIAEYRQAIQVEVAGQHMPRRNLYLVGDFVYFDVLGKRRVEPFCFGPGGYRDPLSKLNEP